MSQQLQITGGAKVRDLQDVIIGTSGVLSSLAFNVANGVPKLDVNGKILVSQLPNSVMEYQGTWNAATNTPTLVNGTGNQGDVYLCNVAGTTNFGAGPITFAVGDSAIYSGTIWQRAGGATGTVTSVGLTSTGNDAITITGSPITTSGNINLGFAGTNLQYINGAGDLTTFPTLISSIGLTMPSAFSVANSPLTANGTIAVTGAGVASQYIRGDGTLADFPTSGGGGSSVSYYLNGGTSQGTIGGVTYYEMSKTADTGTMADFSLTGNGFIVAFLTDAGDPAQLNIPAGNWNYEIYASMSANGGTPEMYAELYKYDGTTFTLIATSPHEILYDGTALNLYTFAMTVPSTTLAITDRLAVKLYATNSGGKTTTVHTQDSHLCQIITTFSTGITALNGLTAQVQYFATGTSGTDFNISSTTATHIFNLPVASAANTGKLSSTDWSTFNNKVPYTGATADVDLGIYGLSANLVAPKQIILKKDTILGGAISIETGSGFAWGGSNDTILLASGASNTLSLRSIVSSVLRTAILDFSTITASSSRTFTLPDLSGTLALTSNLASYVPYTGATGAVNLGVYKLTAAAIEITGGTGTAGNLTFGQSDAFSIPSANNSSIDAITTSFSFAVTAADSSYKYFKFETTSLTNNTLRSYTLPDASGTLPLGTGTTNYHAKWTGTNTIGNSLIWDNGTNVGIGNTNTSYTLDVSGSTRTSATQPSLLINYTDATSYGNLIFTELGTNKGIIQYIGSTFSTTARRNNLEIINAANSDITFFTNNVVKMTITGAGNVGIGTSVAPAVNGLGLAIYASDYPRITLRNSTSGDTTGDGLQIAMVGANVQYDLAESGYQMWTTGGTERMRISSTGVSTFTTTENQGGVYVTSATDNTTIRLASSLSGGQEWRLQTTGGSSGLGAGKLIFKVGGTETASYIPLTLTTDNSTNGGRVGIGNISPSYQLQLSADSAAKPSTNTWTISSDIRVKENINPYIKGLETILKINPVTYDYNGKAGFEKIKDNIGIIAQDVLDILPESISTYMVKLNDNDDEESELYNFNSHALTYVLINAIKEQQIQIQNLQEQINILAK